MQTPGIVLVSLLVMSPCVGACQADKPAASAKGSKGTSGQAIVHHFNETTTLIERGDTLTFISMKKSAAGVLKMDTLVYVFRGDSAEQLTKAGSIPMPAHLAVVLKRFVAAARRQDQMESALGHPLR